MRLVKRIDAATGEALLVNEGIGKCDRCGGNHKIEMHHRIPQYKNGPDNAKNLRPLCQGCHKYLHTRMGLQEQIERRPKDRQLVQWRLRVNELLNTPANILEYGYRSYWLVEGNEKCCLNDFKKTANGRPYQEKTAAGCQPRKCTFVLSVI